METKQGADRDQSGLTGLGNQAGGERLNSKAGDSDRRLR